MPLKTDAVLLYLSGNRYKTLSQAKINQDDLKKYSEFLITKKNQRNKYIFAQTCTAFAKRIKFDIFFFF